MKITSFAITIFLTIAVSAFTAHADLDTFLSDLNSQAHHDLDGFSVELSAQFGVPLPEVHSIISRVAVPADAFMCLQLSLMTGQPFDIILKTYQQQKGNGWGVIAKELGIKPGSDEFHALKNGDFTFPGDSRGKPGNGPGNAKGKDKGKGKGHNK